VLLGFAPLRDVEHHPLAQPRCAVLVADHDGLVVHPHNAPVRSAESVLGLVRRPVPVQSLDLRGEARQIVGLDPQLPELRVAQPFLGRVPEDVLDLWAHVDGLRHRRDRVDVRGGRDRLDQAAIALFGLVQRLLRELAFRDVEQDALTQ
jgi:hypothetical protein